MAELLLGPDWVLRSSDPNSLQTQVGLWIRDGKLERIAPLNELAAQAPAATRIELPRCLVMPGWVNAHQHGRGVSQIQLGHADDYLEAWIAGRRGKPALDPYLVTKLAALEMLSNGVTCAVHANYSYGTGDYEAEVRAQLRAYDEAGLRVTMCIGVMDQGTVVYPPHESCFMNGLSGVLKDWLQAPGPRGYAGGAEETIDLMHRLQADFAHHPRIRFCYGPAGPQWVSDAVWRALADDARNQGLGLHTHAMESPAQRAAAQELFPEGVFRHLDDLGALGPRTVVAHGVWVADTDIELLAKRGVMIARNPGCNLRMRNGIAPLAGYLAHGVRVGIGSDNVTLNDDEDLIGELRLAEQLARDPDWRGSKPPSVAQLLAMLTRDGAAIAQWDDQVGELRPGGCADLVAISMDRVVSPFLDPEISLLRAMLSRTRGSDIRLTMVDGQILYRDGGLVHDERQALRAQVVDMVLGARLQTDASRRALALQLVESMREHYKAVARY